MWTKERQEAACVALRRGNSAAMPYMLGDALAEIERGWAEIERLAAERDTLFDAASKLVLALRYQTSDVARAVAELERVFDPEGEAAAGDLNDRAARARAAFEVAGGPLTPARKEVRLAWQAVVRAVDANRPGLTEEQARALLERAAKVAETCSGGDYTISKRDLIAQKIRALPLRARGEVDPPPPAHDPISFAARAALDDERDERMLRGPACPPSPRAPAGLTSVMHDAAGRPSEMTPLPDRLAAARAEHARLAVDVHRYDGGDRPQSPPAALVADERAAWARVRELESEAREPIAP